MDSPSDSIDGSSVSCKLDRINAWVRDIDHTGSSAATTSSSTAVTNNLSSMFDDDEFNATLSACEANTEALITRSRSPSLQKELEVTSS